MNDWSEDDVSSWLREVGLESLVQTFKANNIDGAELLMLNKESLSSELHIGNTTHSKNESLFELWNLETFNTLLH